MSDIESAFKFVLHNPLAGIELNPYNFSRSIAPAPDKPVLYISQEPGKNSLEFKIEVKEKIDISKDFEIRLVFKTVINNTDYERDISINSPDGWKSEFKEISGRKPYCCWVLKLDSTKFQHGQPSVTLQVGTTITFKLSNIKVSANTEASSQNLTVSWGLPNTLKQQIIPITLISVPAENESPNIPFGFYFKDPKSPWNIKLNSAPLWHPQKQTNEIFTNPSQDSPVIESRLAFTLYNPAISTNLAKKTDKCRIEVAICLGAGIQAMTATNTDFNQADGSTDQDDFLSGVDLEFEFSNMDKYWDVEKNTDSGIPKWILRPRGNNFLEAQEEVSFVFSGLTPNMTPGKAVMNLSYFAVQTYQDNCLNYFVSKINPIPLRISPVQELNIRDPKGTISLSWQVYVEAHNLELWAVDEYGKSECLGSFLPLVVTNKEFKVEDNPRLWKDRKFYLYAKNSYGAVQNTFEIGQATYIGPWNSKWRNAEFISDWLRYPAKGEAITLEEENRFYGCFRVALKYTNERGWYLLIEIGERRNNTTYATLGGGYIKITHTDFLEGGTFGKFVICGVELQPELLENPDNISKEDLEGTFLVGADDNEIVLLYSSDFNSIYQLFGLGDYFYPIVRYRAVQELKDLERVDAATRPKNSNFVVIRDTRLKNGIVLKRNNRLPLPGETVETHLLDWISNWTNAPSESGYGERISIKVIGGRRAFLIEVWADSARLSGYMPMTDLPEYSTEEEVVFGVSHYTLGKLVGCYKFLSSTNNIVLQRPSNEDAISKVGPFILDFMAEYGMLLALQETDGVHANLTLPGEYYDVAPLSSWENRTLFAKQPADVSSAKTLLDTEELDNPPLNHRDFSDTDLSGTNFDVAALEQADFTNANLLNVSLANANLFNASLVNANLVLSNLTYANLNKADLSGARLNYAKLCDTNLNSANLENASLIGTDLSNADLSNANLTNANLATAIVTGTRFSQSAAFSDDQKQELSVRGAIFVDKPELRLVQITEASLASDGNDNSVTASQPKESFRNLQGVIFRGAELSNKNLSNIDLSKADLSGSDLKETNLSYALLREANLSGANLTGANLTEADLTGANLTGTNLTGTTVSKACFDKTIGLSDEQRQALAAQSALLSQPEETVASNADFVTDKPRVQTQYL